MKYALAKKIADRIIEVLLPHTEPGYLGIVGSVRRGKSEVHDIEVCCIAKREKKMKNMFDGEIGVSQGFVDAVKLMTENVIKGAPEGRMMQIVLKGGHGINLDLFMPQKIDYWRQFAIRTGSKDYSHKVIAQAWRNKRWVGTSEGLRREADCYLSINKTWNVSNHAGEKPPEWESEEDFFKWLGLDFIEPCDRNLPKSMQTGNYSTYNEYL